MFSVLSSRRIAATVAGAALLSFTAACGGSGNAEFCAQAPWTKAFTDYSTTTASAGTDLNKFNDASQKLSADLKELAGKTDGDLASALNDFSATWANFKLDPKDPAGAATTAQEMTKQLQEATTKLAKACTS
ncbi:hypothetical protein ACFY19_34875 [Streptosporangium saharense]|uniref:Uncharacterized protein YukE n=1 Tax=Streptosporangium saharense TaxID=1706840 RepID=A0A7W7QUQ6_9ACTN|nr:hypothetical protein [Streptosporangium saharense]MBB4920102.1 uncharacterized protein YukE [Streptosporangium saharense]